MLIFQEYIFWRAILITKEFLEDVCFITQHDHARISLDLFLMISPDITQGLETSEELKYAIRNHDCGWIEYDNVPKIDDSGKVYTFQNMKSSLQDELWMKSITSSMIPYSSLLIAQHFKFLSSNSVSREDNNFVKICDSYISKNYSQLLSDIDTALFEVQLDFLKFTDLLSLILCREREVGKNLIPSIKSLDGSVHEVSIQKVSDSIYKFPPGFLKSKQNMIEIPYKMLPSELILTPKKLKEEFRQSRTKYRRIGLSG
jgi:hypothetical protein